MDSNDDFRSSPRRRSSTGHAVSTYASYLGVSLLSLLNVLLVARILGPVGRGEVTFLMTVAGISGYLFNFSIHEANANLGGLKAHRQPALGTNSLLLSLGLGALAAGVATLALAYAPFLSEDVPASHLAIALASIPAVTAQTYLVYLARGSYRFTIANVALLVAPATALLADATLALAEALTVTTALAAWSGGLALSAGVLAVQHARRVGYGWPDPELAREAVAFGAKSHIGGVLATGSYRMDQWIVGAVSGPRELGLYSVAVAWFEGLFLLPMAVGAVARPDLVRADRAEAGQRTAVLFRVTLLATALLAVALVIAAPVLCGGIFGERFDGSVEPLRLLAIGSLGIVGAKVIGVTLIAQRRPLLESASMGIGFVVAIALYVALIPPLGANGAAIGSAVAYTVAGVAAAVFLVRGIGLAPAQLIPHAGDARRMLRILKRAVREAPYPRRARLPSP